MTTYEQAIAAAAQILAAARAEQAAPGTAGALDATFDQTANNAGGYTIALVAA